MQAVRFHNAAASLTRLQLQQPPRESEYECTALHASTAP